MIRAQEIAAHEAAYQTGISPEVIYFKNEISIYEYIDCNILTPQELREEKNLSKLVELIKIIHNKVFNNLKNSNSFLNIFQIINHKVQALRKYKSLYIDTINELVDDCKMFKNQSKSCKIVFTHNDFYHANLLYDGKKFWLIDWEYAGFNVDVLDLANLSKNIQLIEEEERGLTIDLGFAYLNQTTTIIDVPGPKYLAVFIILSILFISNCGTIILYDL